MIYIIIKIQLYIDREQVSATLCYFVNYLNQFDYLCVKCLPIFINSYNNLLYAILLFQYNYLNNYTTKICPFNQ